MQLHKKQLGGMPSRHLAVTARCQLPSQPKRDVSAAVGSTASASPATEAAQCPIKRVKNALNGALLSTAPEGIAKATPPPGPSFLLPFVGETFEYSDKGPLRFGLERTRKYGPIFKTSLWGSEMVMVTEMELFKAVMATDSELVQFNTAGSFAKLQGDFATNILGNKDGARMPFRRSMLAALTAEAMAGYMPKIWSIASEQVAYLAQQDKWELNTEARKWGMSFANSLLAGLEGLSEEQAQALRTDLGIFFDGLITFDVDLPGTPLRKGMEAKQRLLALINASVERQKEEILKEGAPSAPGVKVRKNMMGYLIDNSRAAGDEINVGFLSTLALGVLQAGTDTSSAGFNGLVVILAQMPDVMERIRQEQKEVVAKYGTEVTKQAIDAMKYTDAVVREALRINTPGLAQFRVPLKDFTLGGYLIPKGMPLFLNVVTSHALELAPDWATSPDAPLPPGHMDLQNLRTSFQPDRWLDPNPDNRPSLLTFGHGPHTCVGTQLYINEAKSIVAALARGYNLQLLTPKIEWQEFPTIKPKHEVYLRITPHKA